MGQTTDEIEAQIDDAREDLGSNIRELETKVKSVTDWKQHFQSNPTMMLGVAFGGGIFLATMLGGGGKKRRRAATASDTSNSPERQAGTDYQKQEALQTWENIKGALIGVAATRFKDFVAEVVPGFQEQFRRTEESGNI